MITTPRVFDHDDFDVLLPERWYTSGPAVVATDGKLVVTGVSPWAAWWGTQRTFEPGDAVLVLFKPGAGSQFEFHLERGTWATPDYRRWAFHVGTRFEMGIWEGADPQRWSELVGDLSPDPQKWYYLFLGIGSDGEFLAYVWEREKGAPQLEYRRVMNDGWAGPGWIFGMGANRGKVTIDSATEITFSRARPPGRAGESFWRALARLDQQDPSGALDDLNTAIRMEPDQATYHYYRAMTLWRLGRLDEALADLRRTSALDPDNDEVYRRLAWLYAKERREPDKARAYIERAMALAPLESRNYRLRALILRDVQNNAQAALADLSRAIELAPQNAELYRLRGETHNTLKDYAAGLRDGQNCAMLQPDDAACYLQQARSHIGLSDDKAAVEAYRRFLQATDRVVCLGCREEAQSFITRHSP
jgi:tetratricopeptide (TPR) repeat protein